MARTTNAGLVFASRETHDGKKHWVEGGVSDPQRNFDESPVRCELTDLSCAADFVPSLDANGFEVVDLASTETAFVNDEAVRQGYYREIEAFLQAHLDASLAILFDHTIRKPNTDRGPIQRVHVDQTTKAAYARVERHGGHRSAELLKKRFQIVNIWRPVANPAARNPLALCDWQTIDPKADMIETDRVIIGSDAPPGETYSVAHSDGQKWYFYDALPTNKVILIKCFDSKDGVARFTPHTAFTYDGTPEDAPERQSIEVRALVFYDD